MLLKLLRNRRPHRNDDDTSKQHDESIPESVVSSDQGLPGTDRNYVNSDSDLRDRHSYAETLEEKFLHIRDKDFHRLDEQQCIYLDYTGASLAPKSLIEEHGKLLTSTVLGNPHSVNGPSQLSTKLDRDARSKVLEFCQADPNEYTVVWTSNASGALKILGECYPFSRRTAYLYGPDCHNSVLGITQYAEAKKARTGGFGFLGKSMCYDWSSFVERMHELGTTTSNGGKIIERLGHFGFEKNNSSNCGPDKRSAGLLAFPGESNTSGLKHNIRRYVDYAHDHGWDVCVDVAAYAATNVVNVAAMGSPDFLVMSFYKMFGFPTGIGCLVAKQSALRRLQKPWFAGGTVKYVGASLERVIAFLNDCDDPATFEDGTINFQSTAAVSAGLCYLQRIGMDDLCRHVSFLSAYTETRLRDLKWPNGAPLVYIPTIESDDEELGHAISMIFLSDNGKVIPSGTVENVLNIKGISIRAGCFCNPSSGFQMLHSVTELPAASQEVFVNQMLNRVQRKHDQSGLESILRFSDEHGLVRVSFGMATNVADIDAFLDSIQADILAEPDTMRNGH